MALITIERIIPATVQSSLMLNSPQNDLQEEERLTEIYISVRGADVVFPYNECHSFSKTSYKTVFSDIQKHLQAILKLLRPNDKMKMAVRLESLNMNSTRTRYLLVVVNGADESCLLGIDYENEATIGLVLAIYNDMVISLDGDGGFRITSGTRHHIFKPVSVQAMWSAFQALHLATKKSVKNNYFEGGSSHSWISYYQERIKSKSFYLHEWHTITDASETTNNLYEYTNKPAEQLNFEELITANLKKIMMSVDLEQVTSKEIRSELEGRLRRDLTEFKSYIDKEMIRIMGQMDEASKILDYLYLGSEWNASNFEELKGKGVKKILNVTSEIDNFFPGSFEYYNIRVEDSETTDMLRYLNDTYNYINKSKSEGPVLVHCKKGISRSASVVVAYIMKEKNCNLLEALEYVKKMRSTIRPNPEFLKQLEIYQGMLNASNKNSNVWRSNSESDLKEMFTKKAKSKHCDSSFSMTGGRQRLNGKQSGGRLQRTGEDKENHSALKNHFQISHRRRSWPPKEAACNEAASGYHFFFNNNHGDKKNGQRRPHHFTSSGFYLGDDSDMENLFSEINKSQSIRSRVKERIEGFEKFKSPDKSQSKKNIANNGLVSNLANQFESKDKEAAMNDLSNLEQFQQQQQQQQPLTGRSVASMAKPPLPRESKAESDGFDIGICLPENQGTEEDKCGQEEEEEEEESTAMQQSTELQQQQLQPHDMTFVFQSLSTRSEYSNRILKRTLSCDHILGICQLKKNSNSNLYQHSTAATAPVTDEFSLKKSKKSFADQRRQQLQFVPGSPSLAAAEVSSGEGGGGGGCGHPAPLSSTPLSRTLSLPNISLNSLSVKKRINHNYSTMLLRQTTTYLRSAPLDLHYIRAQISKQMQAAAEAEGNGGAAGAAGGGSFVKRRTEELEGKSQQDLQQQQQLLPTASVKLNKSKSMPSSPNFHFITSGAASAEREIVQSSATSSSSVLDPATAAVAAAAEKGRPLQYSVSAKSFDFPLMSPKDSSPLESPSEHHESSQMHSSGKKSHKRTYGRSHPLYNLHTK